MLLRAGTWQGDEVRMNVVRRLGDAIAACFACLLVVTTAWAGPITAGTWGEFSFGGPGQLARGCDPGDPSGPFCFPSFGTPTIPLDAAPWTITLASAADLLVTDAFDAGDRFEVFDFGVSLGLTSVPGSGFNCGDDPVVCMTMSGISAGSFLLGSGAHSITIVATLAHSGGGAGYLVVANPVPEPDAAWLALCALAALVIARRTNRSRARSSARASLPRPSP